LGGRSDRAAYRRQRLRIGKFGDRRRTAKMSVVTRGLLALMLVGPAATAQDARLKSRLDGPTLTAVTSIIDSARTAKLPTAPLVDKALEGAAKGSDGLGIVTAVRQLSVRMSSAKRSLGSAATADE